MSNQNYDFVNSFINNVSFPQTLEQFISVIEDKGCYDIQTLMFEAEEENGWVCWTSPRNCVIGDVVLFFHAKSAIKKIKRLENIVKKLDPNEYNIDYLLDWLDDAKELYSMYGAKIFAMGRISSRPERDDDEYFDKYWGSRIYAKVEDLHILDNPIDFEEFNSFIYLARQSAITPLPSKEFELLKDMIKEKNPEVPQWFLNSKIGDYQLSKVNKDNFIELTKNYRKRFPLEINFRSYYVDYFLKVLAGNNVYRECICCSSEHPLARVDNIFEYNDKKILLEVKLNIDLEKDLIFQLNQYMGADSVYLGDYKVGNEITDFEKDYMFVIDVYSVYKYSSGELLKLFDLDDIKCKEDIVERMRVELV